MRHKIATSSAHPSNPFQKRSAYHSSRITKRVAAVIEGDGRLALPRRFRDLCAGIASDLGGAEHLSTIQLDLIRRYAGLAVLAEKLEADVINGREVALGEMILIASTLARLSRRIGLKRVAKDVTPSLDEYLKDRGGQAGKRSRTIDHDEGDDDD